jgi:hypothetical protein
MFLFGADRKDVCEEDGLSLATVEDLYAPISCAEKERKAGHPPLTCAIASALIQKENGDNAAKKGKRGLDDEEDRAQGAGVVAPGKSSDGTEEEEFRKA